MPHEWIIDVLTDLHAYAVQNGMPALAAQVERTLEVARAELAARAADPADTVDTAGPDEN